jgi:hypothetical protein
MGLSSGVKQLPAKSAETRKPDNTKALRYLAACLFALFTIAYAAAIVSGRLAPERRIDAVGFAVLVASGMISLVLFRPAVLDRFKTVEMSGFKLEMLAKVQERQAEQEMQIQDMKLMIPLLLAATERRHLLALLRHNTASYEGNHALRSELRRLRSLGLLAMRMGYISDMTDKLMFDLAERVELTDLGSRWANRILQIEEGDPERGEAAQAGH